MRGAVILLVLVFAGVAVFFATRDGDSPDRETDRTAVPDKETPKETPPPAHGHGHGDVAKAHGLPIGPVIADVTVVDGNGRPFADATVEVFSYGVLRFADPVATMRTGATGLVRLEFPAGSYWLRATRGDAGSFPFAMRGLPPGAKVARTIELHPAGTLSGKVVTETGAPVPGAKLSIVFNPGPGSNPMDGLADDAGRFELPGLPAQWMKRVGVVVDAKDYPRCRFTVDEPKGDVTLRLTAVPIRARVLDEAGKPIRGAYIRCLKPDRDSNPFATTDTDGRFEAKLQRVEGGLFLIDAKGFVPHAWRTGDASEIRLSRGVSLRGKVTDSGGIPIPFAWVYLMRADVPGEILHAAPAGGDGGFKFDAIAEGPHLLQAFRPDRRDLARPVLERKDVRGGGESLALVLPKPLITKVRFPTAVHGTEVVVRDTTGAEVVRRRWPPKLAHQEIRVAVWKDGLYTLEVGADGYDVATVEFRARAESVDVALKRR